MPLIHKTLWLVKEAVVVVVGGGGQNIMAIIKWPPPPPPQLQNTRCNLASPVCSFGVVYSYHSISIPLIHKTLWLVKEAVVVVGGGGGQNIMAIIKWSPFPTAEYKMLPSLALFVHLSGLFISFYFQAINTKTLWLVKEAVMVVVVVGGGGGSKILWPL